MIANFDPQLPITDNWKAADSLNSAWFHYAPPHYVDQYRDSGQNESKSLTLRYMMEKEVAGLVGDGELIALGIETRSSAELIIEIIPASMFASSAVHIDWDKCELDGFGKRFEDVRICKASSHNAPGEDAVAVTMSKRGPKPLDGMIAEALALMKSTDADFADRSQEKQIFAIQNKVAELHPGRFPSGSTPGHTTVWRYLKKQDQS